MPRSENDSGGNNIYGVGVPNDGALYNVNYIGLPDDRATILGCSKGPLKTVK